MQFTDFFPNAEALLALEPEELAGVLLEYLIQLPPDDEGQLNRYNFSLSHTVRGYPETLTERSSTGFESWAKESFEIAAKFAYLGF
jgi:hypothetical protein